MALMTDERRKEMEEEMNRFELEISAPGGIKPAGKPLSPPPPPPAVGVLLPEVLAKAPPPPPPPSTSPPLHPLLRPPPPPPLQPRPQSGPIRFIPHQLHRHPPRPPLRSNFVPMRGMPIGGPPNTFPSQSGMNPFGPPMGQVPGGPQISGSPMPPMHHGPMSMGPGPMHMPPQMGNMNMPMPPGFCPPRGHVPTMAPGTHPGDSQYMSRDLSQSFESAPVSKSTESSPVVAAAPAVYAAPFVKSHAETSTDTTVSSNGQENVATSPAVIMTSKPDRSSSTKTEEPHTVGPTAPMINTEETVVSKKKEKKKKLVRMAGGQAWEDNSLQEWDTDDFRIFCGDLGNDVTDEVLIRAFSKYPSFVKAKVIRDKRTNKTKGYGFVSFKDPQDFIKAMREMNGKYVGSRPIKLRKSTWKDRNIDLVKKKQREKEKLGLL